MQFLLIGFHSVGKASIFFFTFFLPDGAIFSGSIKKILVLFLFSASAYYRANWINNAAIIVWVCWCVGMDVRVWFVCVSLKKIYVFFFFAKGGLNSSEGC